MLIRLVCRKNNTLALQKTLKDELKERDEDKGEK